ncbi:MAG: ATP-binding protein [Bacteroidota bacterium]
MRTYLQLFLLFLPFTLTSQYCYLDKDTPLYSFDLPNGLRGGEVQDIVQDRLGYVWFASKSGLIQYDGNSFTTYAHSVLDSSSISHNAVECILEDRDGNLWIGTWGGGLNKLDRASGTFKRFVADEAHGQLANNYIADLAQDKEGYIWIATRQGLHRLDPVTERVRVFMPQKNNPQSIASQEIRLLYIDREETLWIGTGYPWSIDFQDGGLCRYQPATETFVQYRANPTDGNALKSNSITALFEDSEGTFWVGTHGNHIHQMDRAKGIFDYQAALSNFSFQEDNTQIRSFQELQAGLIIICSYGSGIRIYDKQQRKLVNEIFDDDDADKEHFPLNFAWKIQTTTDGTAWLCTGDLGKAVFKSNLLMPSTCRFWEGDRINAMDVQRDDEVWVARKLNGINRNNRVDWKRSRTYFKKDISAYKRGSWSYGIQQDQPNYFDHISTMEQDAAGNLWMGKREYPAGLIKLNADQSTLKDYSFEGNQINDLAVAPSSGVVYFADTEGQLRAFYPKEERFESLDMPSTIQKLTFLEGSEQLWLADVENHRSITLSSLNLATTSTQRFPILELSRSDTSLKVVNIMKAPNGAIWVGTDRSLSVLQEEGKAKTYWLPSDFPGAAVAMEMDHKGSCWIATTAGMLVFMSQERTFHRFHSNMELSAMPFEFRASGRMPKGDLLFGGQGGALWINQPTMDAFYAGLSREASLSPEQILLTAFQLNGEAYQQGAYSVDSISASRSLTLGHLDNNFSFEFSLLDYNAPKLNRYEYFLEGFDNYWRQSGVTNTAYYSQIPPGNYQLRVRAYNSTGQNGEAIPLQIRILPPWYKTAWAYLAYVLLGTTLLWSIYQFQLKRRLAEAENKRLQEMDTAKTRLYTNITHEFRTPLTVIIGMAKQMEGQVTQSQNRMVDMITRNGKNLLTLVNQMLDLSRLESGQLALQLQHSDLIGYLKYLTESFDSFAESRGVKIHFLSDLERQDMDFDPQKIQQIISNLLSNAIKFTPSGNDIYITVQPADAPNKQLSIKVKDTGIGIDVDRLPHIFERFYQADESHTRSYEGTGIGLALVHELVELMEGEITVKSALNKGSEFTLLLPVRATVPPSKDLSYYEEVQNLFHREVLPTDLHQAPTPTDTAVSRPTLLVVEDNFDVRTYIRACLSDSYHLIMAENGQRGVDRAIEHIPDLIISDVMMPEKDGYSMVQELKKDKRTSHIPIILLTAKADTDSRLLGLQEGVDAYLAKPFNPDELRIRIQKLLELRQQLQEHYRSTATAAEPTLSRSEVRATLEDTFVQNVRQVIAENIDNYDLNVELIAREVGMSHSQLHRKLSALTGLSTNRFIRHLRLTKAKELLRNPNHSITAVAFDSGFSDPGYFGRVFKKETGMTPLEWQQREVVGM